MTTNYHPCICCGAEHVTFVCSLALQEKYTCDVTMCRTCGLAFVNPILASEQLQCLYDNGYWEARVGGLQYAQRYYPRLYRAGMAYGRWLVDQSPHGRLLEIGCGLPFFLKGAADHCAWEVEGVDAADGVAEFAQQKLGLRVRQGRFDGEAFPAESYDVVRAKDVIEHVPDPLTFLRDISHVLRPGGRVELWLPNGYVDLAPARRAYARGKVWQSDAGHVLFISPRVLQRMLRETDFVIEQMSVFSLRSGLRRLGWWPEKRRRSHAPIASAPHPEQSLEAWQQPPKARGFKGSMWYAQLRAWRLRHPSLPVWAPFGRLLWAMARKPE